MDLNLEYKKAVEEVKILETPPNSFFIDGKRVFEGSNFQLNMTKYMYYKYIANFIDKENINENSINAEIKRINEEKETAKIKYNEYQNNKNEANRLQMFAYIKGLTKRIVWLEKLLKDYEQKATTKDADYKQPKKIVPYKCKYFEISDGKLIINSVITFAKILKDNDFGSDGDIQEIIIKNSNSIIFNNSEIKFNSIRTSINKINSGDYCSKPINTIDADISKLKEFFQT